MQFMTLLQKEFELEADTSGMNIAKNQQNYF